jgi:hypothetical protein
MATSGGGGILSKAGSILKGAKGGLLGGGAAALGGMALSYGGDKLKEAGYEKTGGAMDVAGQAASWGGTGAMIGSVIPGVGTAVGAGVGALAGGAYGLYKNWGSFFGDKKEEQGAGQVASTAAFDADPDVQETRRDIAQTKAAAKEDPNDPGGFIAMQVAAEKNEKAGKMLPAVPVAGARARGGPVVEGKSYLVGEKGPEVIKPAESGKVIPNDQLKDLEGQDLKEFQAYAQLRAQKESIDFIRGKDQQGGKATFEDIDPELQAKQEKMFAKIDQMEKALNAKGIDANAHYNRPDEPTPKIDLEKYNRADKIGDLSTQNADAKSEANRPIVVNRMGPGSAAAGSVTNNTIMPRGDVRARESAVEKYNDKSSSFY